MTKPRPDDSDYESEVDPTRARLDLLSAYSMGGRLERDGLLSPFDRRADEAATVVAPPAPEDDVYYYKAPGENAWRAG